MMTAYFWLFALRRRQLRRDGGNDAVCVGVGVVKGRNTENTSGGFMRACEMAVHERVNESVACVGLRAYMLVCMHVCECVCVGIA